MHQIYDRAIPPKSLRNRAREYFSLFPRIKGQALWLWHVPSSTVEFSEEWPHILGYPEEPSLRTDVARWYPEMVHDDDEFPFLEESRKIVEGITEDYMTVFRMRRGDQSWVWLLSRGSVIQKRDGKPLFVAGVLTDVTALRTHISFQHIDGPVNKLDQNMLGNARDAALPPELLAFLQRNVAHVFETGEVVKEQVAFSASDGRKAFGEYSFWPEFGADGKVVASMTQFRDTSDRIIAERTARLNEIRLNALYRLTRMDNAPVDELLNFVVSSLLTITDSESGVLFFMPETPGGRGRVVWSKDLREKVNHDLPNMLSTAELAALFDLPKIYGLERGVIRNGNYLQPVCKPFGGKLTVLRYVSAPVLENDRVICVAAVANKGMEYKEADLRQIEAFISGAWFILRRHEYVKSLKLAKEKAEAATNAMAEFIADVNHELRSPLTSILVYAETMAEFGMEDAEVRKRAIDAIQSQASKMHRLVLDLLDLSRIEGALPLELTVLDLRELAGEVGKSLAAAMQMRRLTLEISMTPGLQVKADRHFLSQVFRNLIENATRYADEGTVIEVRARQTAEETIVSISDQGEMIPEAELERIFERFYRLKHSGNTEASPGTGVGLSICQHVVERHGGRIWAENTGNGVVFHFTLRH